MEGGGGRGVCWRLHYPRNSYTLPLAGATYYKGEMTPGKAFILLDSLGRLQNISPPQRDKSPVPYPQYVSSILQEMLCNNRWYRSILPLAPLCCDISLLKGVVVTRSVPLCKYEAYVQKKKYVHASRKKTRRRFSPSLPLLTFSPCLSAFSCLRPCLSLCVFISRQSIVVPLVGGAEQDDLRADLPSDAVGEMQPDSGMLSLSFQPPRSLSGRKSRRCVLTFGGTVMNIQELCWSLRIK